MQKFTRNRTALMVC